MLNHPHLDEIRERIRAKKDLIAQQREEWVKRNGYYYRSLIGHLRHIIPDRSRILHIGCSTGFILEKLNPAFAVGVEDSPLQIDVARAKGLPNVLFVAQNPEALQIEACEPFDYVLISALEDIVDIKAVLDGLRPYLGHHTRIVLTNYNYLWNPMVQLAEQLRVKYPQDLHNWVSTKDIADFLRLADYETVASRNVILMPFYLPLVSPLLNRFVARLPFFRHLPLMQISVARPRLPDRKREFSVSVVIPCRNEAGNIESAVARIPEMGRGTEIIFCDDKSTDGTPEAVRDMISRYPGRDIKLVHGPGVGKAANVWTGFEAARGEMLMILDGDLTVIPEELPYFYEALANDYGEFINGSRLVYPMQGNAMRFLNAVGNKAFSIMFSFIIGTQLKDTLCGTKALWRADYLRFSRGLRGSWGPDRWGDYDLIFAAAASHRKIIELPVHYMDRTYGETKMTNRLGNGMTMLRLTLRALGKLKFY